MTKSVERGEKGERAEAQTSNIGNSKPISLYPLTPEEALRRAMATPPPPKAQGKANTGGKNVKRR